ncbi:MAG: hypothetical protein ACK56Q_17265, partial [Pirellulaceae bacterium]
SQQRQVATAAKAVESNERSFKKIIHHLAMVATKRWPPIHVAATPGSHRRQGGGEPRKIVQEIRPPSGDGGYEEVAANTSRSNAR